ncbi:MAG: hypothetical protein NTY09_04140 [bacterium]|nr:hypothetical protein [bacterium]
MGGVDAWPIYRLSVDSDVEGYIDLDIDGGSGDQNEYADFRDERYQTLTGDPSATDPYPYDVRPLAPNRLSLLFYGSTYYPNTQYYWGTGNSIDIDGNSQPNPTSAVTRVTYEHQLVAPRHPESYDPNFSGLEKEFNMVVNRVDGSSVNDTDDFVIMRSFETNNPRESIQQYGNTSQDSASPGLGDVSRQLQIDNEYLRQPVANHVINLRFRYWHISGQEMMEIRYDPDETTIGGGGIRSDDGYYRYFDIDGNEIYVWYNKIPGINQKVPLLATDYDQTDLDNVPAHSFNIYGGDSGTDEYDRGMLLFEGWRFVNAISITVRTANNQTLDIYRSTINHNIDADPLNPDYGMGFIDFGLGDQFTDADQTLNMYDPLYQSADNVRVSTAPVGTVTDLFDFVEPNMNPNYNPSAFTTLQTMVYLPAISEKADAAMRTLRFGFWHN